MHLRLVARSLCDFCLVQILKVLSETAVAVRTKAMKCLTAVVESDPSILARVCTVECVLMRRVVFRRNVFTILLCV